MFTGIIETTGKIVGITREAGNIHFTLQSSISEEMKIDQSVAHDGVCLTVIALDNAKQTHTVTAIEETLNKTNLGSWAEGRLVNLERCMVMNGRLDGHIVQGHVDQTATCIEATETNGSWRYTFRYEGKEHVTVEKGSITVNGVSLTVVDSKDNQFSVAIIPYTHEHTGFHQLQVGDTINLEFDIVGKYVARLLARS
ncbi:MAG: riboflavin synthase [Bacteroidetes bacterium]|nr:MAG: riboflavin synthase [Bacteroidota bacterium]